MVLWEMTLATAYFLGLKRTYRLALRIQRRLIGPNHPRIRRFLHRRLRTIFDVAVKVHQYVQQRDIEAGRNLGNWVLRWLDHMKPSAEIRPHATDRCISNPIPKQAASCSQRRTTSQKPYRKLADKLSKGRLLFTSWNMGAKNSSTFPVMMMQPMRPLGMNDHHMQFCDWPSQNPMPFHGFVRNEGVFRKDIALWMHGN